jgi:ATP-binding cassette subfamily B protein
VYQVGITGFNRFMEFLEVAPDIEDAPGAVDVERVRGDVVFRDVSFKYKDGRQDVIKRVSLTIAAGSTWPWWARPVWARRPCAR